jgi:hypothetical protein
MKWKQETPSVWSARAPRAIGGRFSVHAADGAFVVEHLSPEFLVGGLRDYRSRRRLKREYGRATSLSEARVVAQSAADDWNGHDVPAETIIGALAIHKPGSGATLCRRRSGG